MNCEPIVDWLSFRLKVVSILGHGGLQKLGVPAGTLNRFWYHNGMLPTRFFLAACYEAGLKPMDYFRWKPCK